jgi:hypothetical protein
MDYAFDQLHGCTHTESTRLPFSHASLQRMTVSYTNDSSPPIKWQKNYLSEKWLMPWCCKNCGIEQLMAYDGDPQMVLGILL